MKSESNLESSFSVVCAISHGLYQPWLDILYKGQVPTWLSAPRPVGFEVIHFHGKSGGALVSSFDKFHEKIRWTNRWVATPLRWLDEGLGFPIRSFIPRTSRSKNLNLLDKSIQIDFLDIYATMKWKDLAVLDYFYRETDADYLFMTTTSSYIRSFKLMEKIASLPTHGLYAGAVAYPGANFAAGHNRLYSRDVVKKILEARQKLRCGVIEDLALGNLCNFLSIQLIELPKRNIGSLEELKLITDEEIQDQFHFRLTSGPRENRQDEKIMNQLHSRVRIIDGW
jgi:hypothetical protein